MISIKSQVAAFRKNSPESENSDQNENQTISFQNSSEKISDLNLTSDDENQSFQNLLFQNFSFLTSVIRQTRSNFENTTEMSTVSNYLAKVREIDSLNESSNWSEWSRKLKLNLSVTKLWKILIDETSRSSVSDTEQHIIWFERQNQLEDLIDLILKTISRSLIESSSAKNVTKQYKILKVKYNKISISSYALLYRRIFKCSLINHKTLQKYANDVLASSY
jgi:hypothetical protein